MHDLGNYRSVSGSRVIRVLRISCIWFRFRFSTTGHRTSANMKNSANWVDDIKIPSEIPVCQPVTHDGKRVEWIEMNIVFPRHKKKKEKIK